MLITRENMIKILSEKSGYYQQDVRALLKCMDDVVLECFAKATNEEEVSVQLVKGIKVGCTIQPERTRKDPRTQEDIVCAPTCKPNAKFSQDFRRMIQEQYDSRNDG